MFRRILLYMEINDGCLPGYLSTVKTLAHLPKERPHRRRNDIVPRVNNFYRLGTDSRPPEGSPSAPNQKTKIRRLDSPPYSIPQ